MTHSQVKLRMTMIIFCQCRGTAYGSMVACDSPDCHYAWFYFGCVGLTEEPEENGYVVNVYKIS